MFTSRGSMRFRTMSWCVRVSELFSGVRVGPYSIRLIVKSQAGRNRANRVISRKARLSACEVNSLEIKWPCLWICFASHRVSCLCVTGVPRHFLARDISFQRQRNEWETPRRSRCKMPQTSEYMGHTHPHHSWWLTVSKGCAPTSLSHIWHHFSSSV